MCKAQKLLRIDGMVTIARSTRYPFPTGCRVAFPSLLFAVAAVVVSSDPATFSNSCISIRGGTQDEDVALDAYIDELIALADDEPPSTSSGDEIENSPLDSHAVDTSTHPRKRRTSKKKKKHVALQADEISGRTGAAAIKSAQTEDENEDYISVTADLLPQKSQHDEISELSLIDEKEQEEEQVEASLEVVQVDPQKEESGEPEIEADSSQTIIDIDNEDQPQEIVRRYPPPNALYRFLLDFGMVGQVLALLLMFITEYLSAYVPFLPSLLSRVLPQRQLNDRIRQERPPMSQLAASAVTSRRTGQTIKQRRKLTKQADQMALDQLKRVGNVQEAKYRYVTSDFLARHGLGTYAETTTVDETTDEETKQQITEFGALKKDDGGDWVLNALTKDISSKGEKLSGNPTLSVDIDSKGLSAGFEFSLGFDSKQRIQVAKAALMPKNEKKSTTLKVSDRDGFLGRIKAAAGANSKNLLGAYPGDAVSLNEAGDPRGVKDLARRYGWGEWEEEEDTTSFPDSPRSKTKSKRRKASQQIEQKDPRQTDFDVARSPTRSQHGQKSKKKSSRTNKEPHEKKSSEASLRTNIVHKTRRTSPRDPLERLLEAQGKSQRDD